MNKNVALLFALMLCLGTNAQVMKIYKGTTLVRTFTSAEADKVVFEPAIPVQSIELNPTTATLNQGSSITVTALALPKDATCTTLSWTSSKPQVATVKDGIVTGIEAGETTITCEAQDGSGTKATCEITVVDAGMNICVGFYETIPSYSVMNLKETYGEGEFISDDHIKLFGESNVWDFGKLGNFFPAEGHESGDAFISRSYDNPTTTDYITITPETEFGALHFAANFTLIATDGSGETIIFKNCSVTIPENMVIYKSGCRCKVLFNIYDNSVSPIETGLGDLYKMRVIVEYEPINNGSITR